MTQALDETLAALGHLIDGRIARNDATFPSITQPLVPFSPSVQMLPRPTVGSRGRRSACTTRLGREDVAQLLAPPGTPETCPGCREASADRALSSWPRCLIGANLTGNGVDAPTASIVITMEV